MGSPHKTSQSGGISLAKLLLLTFLVPILAALVAAFAAPDLSSNNPIYSPSGRNARLAMRLSAP